MQIALIAHNIRSTYNIGSILRTADGFGVERVYCTGYTPYPEIMGDERLPHIREKLTREIHKTALGAEITMPILHHDNLAMLLADLRLEEFTIAALEQHHDAIPLNAYRPPRKLALILGEEVNGIEPHVLAMSDSMLEIPMSGRKESFNVSVATGIALYALRTQGKTE